MDDGAPARWMLPAGGAVVGAAVVLVAARSDPMLSADSLTYLSAAERLRALDGYADFTGEPLAHFPPVFPAVLAIGGRSLRWASIVGAVSAAVVVGLFTGLLASRVRRSVAVGAAVLVAFSQAAIWVASHVWSETPFLALALLTMTIVSRPGLGVGGAALGGGVAALSFLTRYSGAGLVLTGLVMVVVATVPASRRHASRCAAGYLAGPVGLGALWMARNLWATGEPLGPHFEGGAGEPLGLTLDRLAESVGRLVVDIDGSGRSMEIVGYPVVIGVVAVSIAVLVRRRDDVVDVGMAVFALTAVAVPLVSRVVAGTHVEARIMSPLLVPTVWFAARAVDRFAHRRLVAGLAVLAGIWWVALGAMVARDFPDRLPGSAANPERHGPELYLEVDDLPADAAVLTNNPQRVWWNTARVPTALAFTVPTPGNSHFPLSADETLDRACGEAYLAWFPTLGNARRDAPWEVRPDLAELIVLDRTAAVEDGDLYRLTPRDAGACSSADP